MPQTFRQRPHGVRIRDADQGSGSQVLRAGEDSIKGRGERAPGRLRTIRLLGGVLCLRRRALGLTSSYAHHIAADRTKEPGCVSIHSRVLDRVQPFIHASAAPAGDLMRAESWVILFLILVRNVRADSGHDSTRTLERKFAGFRPKRIRIFLTETFSPVIQAPYDAA